MPEVEMTEFTDLDPEELHLVKRGANGFPPLLAKAVAEEIGAAKAAPAKADDNAGESDEADQIQAQITKSPGVPDAATALPTKNGAVRDTGVSGKRIAPMVSGTKPLPSVAIPGGEAFSLGGSANQVIPVEGKVVNPPPAHLTAKTAYAFATLAQFMDQVAAQREGQAAAWLAQSNPAEQAAAPVVGFGQIAKTLAEFGQAIEALQKGEIAQTDLAAASDALKSALGIVARLAFQEGVDDLEKASAAQLSTFSTATLSAARDQLTSMLEARQFAGKTGAMEADEIMTTLTKEELDQKIKDGTAVALKESMKKERKELKKQIRAFKKALLDAGFGSGSNPALDSRRSPGSASANNNGEVSASDIKGQRGARADADDVNSVPNGGQVLPQYAGSPSNTASKADKKAAKKAAKKEAKKGLKKEVAEMKELLSKVARQPRIGGPNLTGVIPQGVVPAQEGRQDEAAVKSAEDAEIESLRKQLDEAQSHKGPDGMARVQDLSYRLSRAQLRQGHRRGEI